MCERIKAIEGSVFGRKHLAYKLVHLCEILGYIPDDEETRESFERTLAGDNVDPYDVANAALDELNARAVEGTGFEIRHESLYLYYYCDTATTECEIRDV